MRTIKLRGIQFNVDDPAHEAHWNAFEKEEWQSWIFPLYDWLLDKDHSYIDFGAWIGGTTLYASQRAGHCYAFEPDQVAFALLHKNVGANPDTKNITLVNSAIWVRTGIVSMSSESDGLGKSDTSIMLNNPAVQTTAGAVTFDDFRRRLFSASDTKLLDINDCNLIKFDIEGAEFEVLPNMYDFLKEKRPSIILSAHQDRTTNPKQKMADLKEMFGFYKYFYYVKGMKEAKGELPGEALFTDRDWNG